MKKWILIFLLLIVLLLVGAVSYIKFALPNVGPAPELKVDASTEMIERGKYLANSVCVCMDCHSTRDWSKFAGPLKPGTLGIGGEAFTEEFGFPGKYYSKNITPFALASWTDGEIFRAITTGVSKDGRAMFPVMPYHNYGKMDTEDAKAIVAYLRTLSPIESTVQASVANFPMNIIINTIPQKAIPVTKPDSSQVLEYGAYIANAAACIECHTKQDKGEKLKGMEFAGGFEFKLPQGTVRSANITPHETGLSGWSREAFINRFKIYADSAYKAPDVGDGLQTVMPWLMYATMTREDLGAIYDYLQSIPPVDNKVERFTKN
jgi:mono/diheme cytochrome c family protein